MNSIRGTTTGNRYQPRQSHPPSRRGDTNNNAVSNRNRHHNSSSSSSRPSSTIQQESAADAPPDTEPPLRVLSFVEQNSHIAYAAYIEESNEIIFDECTSHNGHDTECFIRGALLECHPNLIVVGSKVVGNGPLLDCLVTMPTLGEDDDDEDNDDTTTAASNKKSIPYQLLKSAAFDPRTCRTVILEKLRVLTLMHRLSSSSNHHSNNEYHRNSNNIPYNINNSGSTYPNPNTFYHALASVINFDSPSLIRALGSLVTYLQNTAFRLEEGHTVTVNDIRCSYSNNECLRLDDTTMRTLRIFATDFHPLSNTGGGGKNKNSYNKSKEGFSIYTLLDRTKSKGGKERLRQWMMQPLRNPERIQRRHVAMELFLHPSSHGHATLLLERLGQVGNMDGVLLRMQRCCSQPNDFLVLGRMLEAAYGVVMTLGDVRERAVEIDREGPLLGGSESGEDVHRQQHNYPSVAFVNELMGRCHAEALRKLRERLASVIDEEVTAEVKDHVVIHYGFHEELDRAKETFETLDGERFRC